MDDISAELASYVDALASYDDVIVASVASSVPIISYVFTYVEDTSVVSAVVTPAVPPGIVTSRQGQRQRHSKDRDMDREKNKKNQHIYDRARLSTNFKYGTCCYGSLRTSSSGELFNTCYWRRIFKYVFNYALE